MFASLGYRLDCFLESVDVDGVVAMVHGPGDVADEAHADFFGNSRPRGLGDHVGPPAESFGLLSSLTPSSVPAERTKDSAAHGAGHGEAEVPDITVQPAVVVLAAVTRHRQPPCAWQSEAVDPPRDG
jgi:hypothetical protein